MSNLSTHIEEKMNSIASRIASAQLDSERLAQLKKNIGKVVVLPINEIDNTKNIRQGAIDTESIKFRQLVSSIQKDGLLQNIVVELREEEDGYRLICLAGHRRIKAMLALGKERITCLLLEKRKGAGGISAALSENQNREDLHFLDVADGYAELTKQGWTLAELSEHYERDEKTLKRYLKLAGFSPKVKSIIRDNHERLSLRVVMHEFVNKAHKDEASLLKAIKSKFSPERQGASAKNDEKQAKIKSKLQDFYKSKAISEDTQVILEDALRFLKIIKS